MYSSRHVKVSSPTLSNLQKDINLQIYEVAALWTPIYELIHPGHWDPLQFRDYSCEHYEGLRQSSYKILREMIESLTFGGSIATMNIGVDSRIRMLLASSLKKINNVVWPAMNPDLPPESASQTWGARPEMYPRGNKSKGLVKLLERFGGDLSLFGSSVSPEAINIATILSSFSSSTAKATLPEIHGDTPTISKTNSGNNANHPIVSPTDYDSDDDLYHQPPLKLPDDHTGKITQPVRTNKSSITGTPTHMVQTPLPHNVRTLTSPLSQPQLSSHSPMSKPQTLHNTPTGLDDPYILDSKSDSESDTDREDEFDPNILADDEASPGLSTFLQIGGEHVNVTDEMVARIETMVQTEWEADIEIIAAYTESHDAWEEISKRALTLGRLSFLGAAHYVIQGLAAEHNQAAEIVRHFVKKMDRCQTQMENLTEARLRAEQNRFILNAASTKTDDAILRIAKEKHKQLMGEYGSTISSTISPERKRKSKNSEIFLRRTLKKARRSGSTISTAVASTVPSKSSFRVPSESYAEVESVSNSVLSPDSSTMSANSSYRRQSPTVRAFGEPSGRQLAIPLVHDLDTPPTRTIPSMTGTSSFAEDMESLDN